MAGVVSRSGPAVQPNSSHTISGRLLLQRPEHVKNQSDKPSKVSCNHCDGETLPFQAFSKKVPVHFDRYFNVILSSSKGKADGE